MKLNSRHMRAESLVLFVTLLFWLGEEHRVQASSTASASANATATVLSSISLSKTRDLSFGNGAPGDGTKVVIGTDSTNSASFNVTGAASAAYNITLPADGTTTMITAGGG